MINLFKFEVTIPQSKEREFVEFMRKKEDEIWLPVKKGWDNCKDDPAFSPYYNQKIDEEFVTYQNFMARYGHTSRYLRESFEAIGWPRYAIICCEIRGTKPSYQLLEFHFNKINVLAVTNQKIAV